MTIPERTPLALDHGLNAKRIAALVELLDKGTSSAHHATLASLRDRDMVRFRTEDTRQPYLTEHGKTVARGLLELDDTPEEAAEAPAGEWCAEHQEEMGDHDHETDEEAEETEQVTHRLRLHESAAVFEGTAALFPAAYQVICRPRRSGEHSQLIAVVVGSESDAQRVADQWNLAHIADIAGRADATYAVAVPAEVGVYLFEWFAVVAHD